MKFRVTAYQLGDAEWTTILDTDDGAEARRAADATHSYFCVMVSRTDLGDRPYRHDHGQGRTPRDHYLMSHSSSDPDGREFDSHRAQ